MNKSVVDYLEKSASRFPEKDAYIDEKGAYKYSEVKAKAQSVGTALKDMGLKDNGAVAVFLDKEKDAIVCFFGVAYAGGIYSPMDVHAPVDRLSKIMEVMQPAFLITDEEHYEKACELVDKSKIVLKNDLFEKNVDSAALEKIQRRRIDTDPLYLIFTSGSTGIPKGVVISHRAVIDFVEESSEYMDFSEKEVFANQAPFYFDASVPDLYCTVRNAATLHIIPEKWYTFPIDVLEYIKNKGVNAIFWVPSALIVTANLRALREVDATGLKKIMFCGEVMPVKQYNMWKKAVPDARYVNYYGPSETTYASTYYEINREFTNDQALPIGNAALNTGVLILNDEDKLCESGKIGELCIRGSGVSNGYYNNPEKTAQAFVQNPLVTGYHDIMYRTGDLVKENEYGEIEYVGRKDFQIKHMGYRIELGEIETAAISAEGVERVCCIYNDIKHRIVMLYEGNAGEDIVKEVVAGKVPEYMIPGIITRLDSLPMNANGKIDRKQLKEVYGN